MVVATVRSGFRWAAMHGLARAMATRASRAGDLSSRLMLDPTLRDDPYGAYDRIRETGPFVTGRMVLSTARHDVCTAVLRSADFGVAGRGDGMAWPVRAVSRIGGPGPINPVIPPSMLGIDGPAHARIRKLVTRAFTAKAIAALRVRTREVADDLLDDMAADGAVGDPIDLVAGYASSLPVVVISEILGVPGDMRDRFLAWGDDAAMSLDIGMTFGQFRSSERGLRALQAWMTAHVERLRRDPGPDVLSTVARAEGPDGLSSDEVVAAAMLLLAAGFETTVNLLSSGAALLMAHPEQRAVLRADPSLWGRAVDEILRYDSPVQRTGRVAERDTEVAGRRVRAGSVVLTLIGGANRDPAVFDDPARFDVTRANAAEHLAFSSGPHYCLGAALARMEGEIGLSALFERFPDLTPCGPARRRGTRTLRGYRTLPVRAVASSRAA